MNRRDGDFPKAPKLYILNIKLASIAGFGVKISFYLRGSIKTQKPKVVIFSGSSVLLDLE